jgi:Fe-S-cluster containining protein
MPKMELPKMPNILKQTNAKVRLQQYHARVVVPEETPPCNECKTAACCSAFVVGLSQDEYDSGLYEPYAIEFTPEAAEQLQRSYTSILVGFLPTEGMHKHVLEGRSGEPCPFLRADKKCGVYNNRPAVCRAYTCVGDHRITQAMRDGTE